MSVCLSTGDTRPGAPPQTGPGHGLRWGAGAAAPPRQEPWPPVPLRWSGQVPTVVGPEHTGHRERTRMRTSQPTRPGDDDDDDDGHPQIHPQPHCSNSRVLTVCGAEKTSRQMSGCPGADPDCLEVSRSRASRSRSRRPSNIGSRHDMPCHAGQYARAAKT
jgi:hypothetical protein